MPRYTRRVRVLFLCTANLCRSPMAAALFAREAPGRAGGVESASAGLLPGGRAVPSEVLEVMAPYGLDLSGHRSRRMTGELVGGSDLVVGMGRRHVREAVVLEPEVWPRAFTLKDLVRRRARGRSQPGAR